MAESMEVDGEGPVRHLLPGDSIKIMGESIGVSNLSDDATARLSEDLEYRLKEVIQDAVKFMRHSKRKRLACADIDHALRAKNIEPLYGFDCADYLPFRHTSGGGKELFYPEEKEIDLIDLVNSPLPRLPYDITLRAHWLSVDGIQPSLPENPAPLTINDQREVALAAALPHANISESVTPVKENKVDKKNKKKDESVSSSEWLKLKPLQAHALSLEQQLYYKEITDACIGLSDSKRQEALSSLASDPGLYQLLPQFTSFITEGVKVNIAQRKLNILKHLLKMVKSLLENSSLSMEKYLHELTPAILTCLINKQVCLRPEAEDHWSLRELAAKILAEICKKYSNSVNNIQSRMTRVFSQALKNNTQGLAVHYGAMVGLIELGQETITSLIIPKLKVEGELVRLAQGQPSRVIEHVAANRLQGLLQRHCAPILMNSRPASDTLQQYQEEFGFLGQVLFNQVKTLRQNRAGLGQLPQQVVRLQSPTLKSPTTPTLPKGNKPPPLSIPSPQLAVVKSSSNGTPKPQTPISSLSSPTLAAALRLVSQTASQSSPAASINSPGIPIPVSLLSAVMGANPTVLASHLTTALAGGTTTQQESQANTAEQKPKTPC